MKKMIYKSTCKYFILVELVFMLVSCGDEYMCYEANDPLRFPSVSKSYNNAKIFCKIKPSKDMDGRDLTSVGLKFGGDKEPTFTACLREGDKYVLPEFYDEWDISISVYSNGKIYDYLQLGEIKHIIIIDDNTLKLVYNDLQEEFSLRFYKKGKKRVERIADL